MFDRSTTPRTETTLATERLEETAAGLQKLLLALYEEFDRTPGQYSAWENQTSSGIFLYQPRRNCDLIIFTPWGELGYGNFNNSELERFFRSMLSLELVLEPDDGLQYELRGHLYAVKAVGDLALPPSVLTREEHSLDATAAKQSLNAHLANCPFIS